MYRSADPQNLGEHRYERESRYFQTDEKETGIIYTTQAGFLDLAHMRMTIDWTRYCMQHIRKAMDENQTELHMMGSNGGTFYLTLRYPDDWQDLEPADREELENELALRAGEQLAYLFVTWHEMVTWFGYRTIPLFSEKRSAFTYDDVMSHVVGVRIADRALRDDDRTYDEAVTLALKEEMQVMGAVSPANTSAAVDKVKGVWWSGLHPLKRQMGVGLSNGVVHPWLVRGLPFTPDTPPRAFQLPSMNDVLGRNMSNFYTVMIDPSASEADEMRQHLPNHPQKFSADHDVPILLGVVYEQMLEEFNAKFDQPWDVDSTTPISGTAISSDTSVSSVHQ